MKTNNCERDREGEGHLNERNHYWLHKAGNVASCSNFLFSNDFVYFTHLADPNLSLL